jgi:hypothetical protein
MKDGKLNINRIAGNESDSSEGEDEEDDGEEGEEE